MGLFATLIGSALLPAADDDQRPIMIPGGVADPAGRVGYLSNPKGGLVAIDLEKGDVLWESKDANRPLAVIGKRLAALVPDQGASHVVRVIILDSEAKGKKLAESAEIKLPEWAVVGTGLDHHRTGKAFNAQARLAKGDLLLCWWASTRYFGGAAPTREIEAAAAKEASGIARIHVESGKVEALPGAERREMTSGFSEAAKLPQAVQAVAQREMWQGGAVVGPRAFGQIQKSKRTPGAFGDVLISVIQAVDLKTGKILWERAFEEQRMLPPPP